MAAVEDCIFCKIVAEEIPSFKLFEDELTFAFMDINPANPGHVLVVPKTHAKGLFSAEPTDLAATVKTAQIVARAVNDELQPAGLNLVQANGPGAAQSVFHFHLHVLPRGENDGLGLNWGISPGNLDAISVLADRIRSRL